MRVNQRILSVESEEWKSNSTQEWKYDVEQTCMKSGTSSKRLQQGYFRLKMATVLEGYSEAKLIGEQGKVIEHPITGIVLWRMS